MKPPNHLPVLLLAVLCAVILAACASTASTGNPALEAARQACQADSGMDYACIERLAVTTLNPDICRLAGIAIDDACLQAVYEAASDPAICDRIYLQGVVPNCRAYYAHFTPSLAAPAGIPEIPAATLTPLPSSPPPPTITPTSTATASPTPLYTLDLSAYDPALLPPIDVSHNPPLILRADETADLVFSFANTFCMKLPVSCIPQGVLHYAYGEAGEFQSMPLTDEVVEEMESLVGRLPATDESRAALRYYAEFSVPQAGYTQRYPAAGTIDLYTADEFIPVNLPVESPVKPGDKVYNFYWGYGIDKMRQATYEGYPQRVGPPALDVSDDGILALMDPVNERIITFEPKDNTFINYVIPFTYQFNADLAFDPRGRLMVCDYQGQENQATFGPDPVCYLLRPGGNLEAVTPIYVISPGKINRELKILDYNDHRLVPIFNASGQPNSREVQIDKETWDLPYLYLEYPYLARYADMERRLAFEVRSASPLGALTEFQRTPKGYLLVFNLGDRIRAVWIDPAGAVQKDLSLPYSQFTEINFNGQSAVAPDGSLYTMSSTKRGIEIHFVVAP